MKSSQETIYVGDIIEYWHPIHVAGEKQGYRTGKVLSVDPTRNPILVTSTGEFLPTDHPIRRLSSEKDQSLLGKRGHFQNISDFNLVRDIPDGTNLTSSLEKERKHCWGIIESNMEKFKRKVSRDEFAPMDLLHNFDSKESAIASTESNEELLDLSEEGIA